MKKHNRKLIRAPWWDYGFAGWYSVTIRVQFQDGNRDVFGNIESDKMYLNDVGRIVEEEWLKSPGIRKDMNITLDEYQVMPDHFHGIIQIGQNEFNRNADTCIFAGMRIAGKRSVGTRCSASLREEANNTSEVGTRCSASGSASLQQERTHNRQFGPQSKNLSITINQFKGAVTRRARAIGRPVEWQERFHDRIIRNKKELERLRQYIRDNPRDWKFGDNGDEFPLAEA
ncbi:MAG: hypothetical protein NVV59_07045 [Chitinophagaceae bacterium]|nr:hypothetical protein [Chitinophagaceae bacterium]